MPTPPTLSTHGGKSPIPDNYCYKCQDYFKKGPTVSPQYLIRGGTEDSSAVGPFFFDLEMSIDFT